MLNVVGGHAAGDVALQWADLAWQQRQMATCC